MLACTTATTPYNLYERSLQHAVLQGRVLYCEVVVVVLVVVHAMRSLVLLTASSSDCSSIATIHLLCCLLRCLLLLLTLATLQPKLALAAVQMFTTAIV
jgi:hypothetical protein